MLCTLPIPLGNLAGPLVYGLPEGFFQAAWDLEGFPLSFLTVPTQIPLGLSLFHPHPFGDIPT